MKKMNNNNNNGKKNYKLMMIFVGLFLFCSIIFFYTRSSSEVVGDDVHERVEQYEVNTILRWLASNNDRNARVLQTLDSAPVDLRKSSFERHRLSFSGLMSTHARSVDGCALTSDVEHF